VTPRLVSPGSERVQEMIDGARKLYREASSSVSFNLFD
jgi:hypothetical protein